MSNIFFDINKLKYLGEGCIIGKSVRIRNPERCIIGDGTIIDDFTYISAEIEIGKNCHISSNVSISGGGGKFIMGDYSTLSAGVSVHCASSDYKSLSLDLPSVPIEYQFGGIVKNIYIDSFVTIGAHSCILPGVKAMFGSACGAYSLLKEDMILDKFSLYVGIPAKKLMDRDFEEIKKSELFKKIDFNI